MPRKVNQIKCEHGYAVWQGNGDWTLAPDGNHCTGTAQPVKPTGDSHGGGTVITECQLPPKKKPARKKKAPQKKKVARKKKA
jgi:hypothetical protein